MQSKQQAFTTSLIERGENSFKESGLPTYLYYNGTGPSPNTLYQVNGSNFQEVTGVNTNLPYYTTGNPLAQIYKAGRPSYNNRDTVIQGSSTNNSFTPPSPLNRSGAQSDRAGLGYGRFVSGGMLNGNSSYNAVPPPSFNSAGTQTMGNTTRSIGTQNPGPGPRVLYGNTQPKTTGWVPINRVPRN